MKNPTVVMADDEVGIRQMFAILLRLEKVDVGGEARDGAEALRLCKKHRPDFLMTDLRLPGLDAESLLYLLRSEKLPIPVMIYTGCEDDRRLAAALAARPAVMVHKLDPWSDFLRGVRCAVEGSTFCSPRPALVHRSPRAATGAEALSEGETVLVKLIASGKSNKEAADMLGISEKGVENRRGVIMRKLDLHNGPAITLYAVAHGLVEAEGGMCP